MAGTLLAAASPSLVRRVPGGDVLLACWSAKGGSGTTVVASGLAALLARRSSRGCLLVDLAGDVPAVLGLDVADAAAGAHDWLASSADVGPDALRRLEVDAGAGLAVLPAGRARSVVGAERLVATLTDEGRPVVVDCGLVDHPVAHAIASQATLSLLVIRPCYLALRRAASVPVRPSAVVVIEEADRALRVRDIELVLDAPVRAVVPWRGPIARAVDAGLLGRRIPTDLARALGRTVAVAAA